MMNIESSKSPNLNQKEINSLNRPISSEKMELVIKELPTKNLPGPVRSRILAWFLNDIFQLKEVGITRYAIDSKVKRRCTRAGNIL